METKLLYISNLSDNTISNSTDDNVNSVDNTDNIDNNSVNNNSVNNPLSENKTIKENILKQDIIKETKYLKSIGPDNINDVDDLLYFIFRFYTSDIELRKFIIDDSWCQQINREIIYSLIKLDFIEKSDYSFENIEEEKIYIFMKKVKFYNFSFFNIKIKDNLKSIYNQFEPDTQEVFIVNLRKLIQDTTKKLNSQEIIIKLTNNFFESKSNLMLCSESITTIIKILGNKKTTTNEKLNIIKTFNKTIYDKDFLHDIFSYLKKLLKDEDLTEEELKVIKEQDIEGELDKALKRAVSIKFIGEDKFKYYHFTLKSGKNQITIKRGVNTTTKEPHKTYSSIMDLYEIFKVSEFYKPAERQTLLSQLRNKLIFTVFVLSINFINDEVLLDKKEKIEKFLIERDQDETSEEKNAFKRAFNIFKKSYNNVLSKDFMIKVHIEELVLYIRDIYVHPGSRKEFDSYTEDIKEKLLNLYENKEENIFNIENMIELVNNVIR